MMSLPNRIPRHQLFMTAMGILWFCCVPWWQSRGVVAVAADWKEHQSSFLLPPPKKTEPSPPNFVIVLVDDLDRTLTGRASTLSETYKLVGGQGIEIDSWFAQTPVCCPSRAEMLTGKLYHNLRTASPNQAGCMHVDVADDRDHPFWKTAFFSNHFGGSFQEPTAPTTNSPRDADTTRSASNYRIGLFGKLLNMHNPTSFIPNGVDEMLINGGGAYLNPTFTHGRKRSTSLGTNGTAIDEIETIHFDDCTNRTGMPCYSTSVIGNASLAWIRRQVLATERNETTKDSGSSSTTTQQQQQQQPFLALISVKAPHIQDGDGFPMGVPAPWYNDTPIAEHQAPRTPNYNWTDDHHHWLVRSQPPLTTLQGTMIDDLHVSRLRTLLSVDDLVRDLVDTLEELDVLENTYIFFTSDNGYRLGQFRMPQCKLHPYENDIRVPMMIRGPGIVPKQNHGRLGRSLSGGRTPEPRNKGGGKRCKGDLRRGDKAIFSHIHLMPTLLGLATGLHTSQDIIPDTMDGTNLAHWLVTDHGDSGDDACDDDRNVLSSSRETPKSSSSAIRVGATITERSLSSSLETPKAPIVHKNQTASRSISLLIEYTSLGNVVRYQHLIDTYNHTFVALRILQINPETDPPRTSTSKVDSSTSRPLKAAVGVQQQQRQEPPQAISIQDIPNLKYIEFRDSRIDWTNTETPPLERELYDLDKDPYERHNLIASPLVRISPSLLQALEDKTKRLVRCRGASCREEHSTGLDLTG